MNGKFIIIFQTAVGSLLAFLLWQIMVNTGRLSTIEAEIRNHEQADMNNMSDHKAIEERLRELERRIDGSVK